MTSTASGEPSTPARWTDAYLAPFRLVADPEADAISGRLFEAGGPRALAQLTRELEDWEAPLPADSSAELRDLFERPVAYPAWVDPDKIAHAEDLFVAYGPVTTSLILLNAFPRFLTNPAGARAFYTARIFSPDSLRNRMMELLRFVLYMTERGGLGQSWLSPAQAAAKGLPAHGVRKGRGMVAYQKLRIIHSNVRILLKLARQDERPAWDLAAFGEPINQEDLAGAVMCFALCTMEGLSKAGIEQTREDQEAMLVAWQATAVLLGVRDELQPRDLDDAFALREALFRRHSCKTHEATVLANEVLHIVEGLLPRGSRRVPAALMRYQLGDEVADQLGVPNPRWLLRYFAVTRPLWKSTRAFERLSMMVSPILLRWVASSRRLGAAGRIELPEKWAARLGSEH